MSSWLRFAPIASALSLVSALPIVLSSCTVGEGTPPRPDAGPIDPIRDGGFFCAAPEAEACLADVHYSCESDGEFLRPVQEDCRAMGLVCEPGLWCVTCHPGQPSCDDNGDAVICADDGSGTTLLDDCDTDHGEFCDLGRCVNLCEQAVTDRSYLGCEFYAVDLDNAAIGAGRDASSQQYAIVVSNPGNYATDVVVEIDTGSFGDASTASVVAMTTVLPGDLEVFALPRREVDGSSFFQPCASDAECGSASQQCWCRDGMRPGGSATDCRCRNASGAGGLNDGTHSALTSHAYRIRSELPIIAYQFNPLDNVGVFSNDASMLIPTSAIGTRYTVIGWPQTIANSTSAAEDFDGLLEPEDTEYEDLRAFLTIVGTEASTHVTVTLGPQVRYIVPPPSISAPGVDGDVWEFDLGAFDVVNLESQGFNADFTGTTIVASAPVSVFTGSEASDAPRFEDLANRRCCADHLEEQLFADNTLGRRFFIGRTPPRSPALDAAFIDTSSVGSFEEPEYVRILAVEEGLTDVTTTLPPPDDFYQLEQGESVIISTLAGEPRRSRDFEINATRAISVLQAIASQEAVGIPNNLPGGDPAIIAVPPFDQWRRDYVFLTPGSYAFDFVTIVAPRLTQILLDERPLADFECEIGAADGRDRRMGDPPPDYVVYRCQLSYPDVIGPPNVRVEPGVQDDGYHTLRATDPVSIVITGFDAFVSYGYVGGANLTGIR